MAFQNILFPNPKLIHGLKKEIIQGTKIISNGNTEYRLSKNDPRRRWIWPSRAMSNTDKEAIVNFVKSVDMSLDSFRFYDPFEKTEIHVRFDMAAISFTAEVLDSTNSIVYVNISDIALIEVFE